MAYRAGIVKWINGEIGETVAKKTIELAVLTICKAA
jgi:hypothetical protein